MSNTTSIIDALNILVRGRVELKDVLSGKFDPVDLIDLAKDLNDIAAELKRRAKAKSRGSASVTEGGGNPASGLFSSPKRQKPA
jgi:hypothetical protein